MIYPILSIYKEDKFFAVFVLLFSIKVVQIGGQMDLLEDP